MKHSKYITLGYQYLVDLFSIDDKQEGNFEEIEEYNPVGVVNNDETSKIWIATDDLKKKREKIIEFLNTNKDVFDQLDLLVTDYEQYKVLMNPTIHVARSKDTLTDIEYFKAKTFFPYPNGERKEVKIHLGKAENYDFDTKSDKAKKEALWKMRQTLARRIREGSL